jgi:hypothetical protein
MQGLVISHLLTSQWLTNRICDFRDCRATFSGYVVLHDFLLKSGFMCEPTECSTFIIFPVHASHGQWHLKHFWKWTHKNVFLLRTWGLTLTMDRISPPVYASLCSLNYLLRASVIFTYKVKRRIKLIYVKK